MSSNEMIPLATVKSAKHFSNSISQPCPPVAGEGWGEAGCPS